MNTKATSAISQFVASDEQAKKAASVPAGAWPFATTAAELVKASPVKAAPKRATIQEKAANKAAAKTHTTPIAFVVRANGATDLFAHTAAWLELTGLIHGKSAPVDLVKEMGGTAYAYHLKQGNFTQPDGGMVQLTAKGINHFRARETGESRQSVDQGHKEHYMLMMMEGLHDGALIKSETAIRPYAPK